MDNDILRHRRNQRGKLSNDKIAWKRNIREAWLDIFEKQSSYSRLDLQKLIASEKKKKLVLEVRENQSEDFYAWKKEQGWNYFQRKFWRKCAVLKVQKETQKRL